MRKLWLAALAGAVLCLPAVTTEASGGETIFRPATGLWATRGVTRIYFGRPGDAPVLGDYTGDRVDEPAIFRASSGLWAARGVTRVHFGTVGDEPKPGDYTGDGKTDIAIFRPATGLWAVRGVTRMYFGRTGDVAIAPLLSRVRLLQTGQTASCRAGDDGHYRKGVSFSYQTRMIAGGLVTIDNATGLMWASDGLAAGCNNGDLINSWSGAIDWAEGLEFAGYSDWRLPNVRELLSLVNYSKFWPALDKAYFPGTGESNVYWSSTIYVDCDGPGGVGGLVWAVEIADGGSMLKDINDPGSVRAVRAGE